MDAEPGTLSDHPAVASGRARGPIETVHPEFRDMGVIQRAARRAVEMGFGGMLCIHPSQVTLVNDTFLPTADQLAWAKRVIAAAEQDAGAGQIDGQMIDAPVMARADGSSPAPIGAERPGPEPLAAGITIAPPAHAIPFSWRR